MSLISRVNSILLIIDCQARLVPAMSGFPTVEANIIGMVQAARLLHVPLRATEHCPDKIGPTVDSIRERVQQGEILSKTRFSGAAEPSIVDDLAQLEHAQVVIAGIEAHVCVLQSAVGLLQLDYQPFLVVDGVTSRSTSDKAIALKRLTELGIQCVTTEMVLFEWLERGDTADFKSIIPLIKRLKL